MEPNGGQKSEREREREREEDKARGRSRLQPKRIGARGLNDPSLLGRHPGSPPPVSRFTAIRFLPPLRALVLSYCLRCCFLVRSVSILSSSFFPPSFRFDSRSLPVSLQFFPRFLFAVFPHQRSSSFPLVLLFVPSPRLSA